MLLAIAVVSGLRSDPLPFVLASASASFAPRLILRGVRVRVYVCVNEDRVVVARMPVRILEGLGRHL